MAFRPNSAASHTSRGLIRLRTERLESRSMMAGDVTVRVADGNLVIEGDAESNQIGITNGMVPGSYVVAGLAAPNGEATTVNGQMGRIPFTGVRGNIVAALGRGNDLVNIPALRASGNVAVRMGEGNDRVFVGAPPTEGDPPTNATVRMRGGLEVSLGAGEDVAGIHGVLAERVFVAGGDGSDTVRLAGVRTERGIGVHGGLGNDAITVGRVSAVTLEISGDAGNDQVRITDAALRGLVVRLGDGDDVLSIGNSTIQHVVLDGNEGMDRFLNLPGNRFGRVHIRNFENGSAISNTLNEDESVDFSEPLNV